MAPQLRARQRQFLLNDSHMSRAPKRDRKSCKPEENGCEDRLSDLPDAILCHILSFLDTKYAVATSVLSTRWKYLFIYVPNIILDNSLTGKTSSVGVDQEFALFGLRQLMLRKLPYINQFHLNCNFNFEDPVIETLLRTAVWRSVKEINICMGELATVGSLPFELFTCSSLVVLKLKTTGVEVDFLVPELVCLPNLKVLCLDGFELGESVNTLFQGCELLEDLCLCRCYVWELSVLDITLPSLRKLSFIRDHWLGFSTSMTRVDLVLDTPNLELLQYNDCKARSLKMKKSIPNARAEFYIQEWGYDSDSDDELDASEFINNFRGIKSLYLSKYSLEAMYPGGASPSASGASVFESLTRLELGAYDLRILPSILACAPELETLIIHEHGYDGYEDFQALYPLPQIVPICLANALSNIEFRYFDSSKDEFELMKYLLQNGKVLRRMKVSRIDSSWAASTQKSIHKKLKMLSRFSETCKIMLD